MTDFLLWLYYTMTGINKTINRTIYSACFENILYMCGVRACFPLPCLPAPLIPFPSPLMPSRTPHAFPHPSCLPRARGRCPGAHTGADEVPSYTSRCPLSPLPFPLPSCLPRARGRCPGVHTGADEVSRAHARELLYRKPLPPAGRQGLLTNLLLFSPSCVILLTV